MEVTIKRFAKNDYLITAVIFLALTLTETVTNHSMLTPDNVTSGFAAEYGNIAASVAKGEGFANVFTEDSGPTAWHPPLLVYLMASVFFLFGVKSFASMWVFFLLQSIAYAFIAFFLLKIADLSGFKKYRWLCVVIYLFLLLFNYNTLVRGVDDVYLITFLSVVMVYSVVKLIKAPSKKGFIYLYVLAFALPLTAPSMALAFAVLLFGHFVIECVKIVRNAQGQNVFSNIVFHQPHLRAIIFSGLIFIFAVSAWSYRNYLVFDKFIPIKSNLWVEFYFANVLDDDGLLNKEFYRKHHPFKGAYLLDKYQAEGEIQFVEESKYLAQKQLEEDPGIYLERVGNRMINAFVHTEHIQDTKPANMELFSEEELEKLHKAQLLILEHWTSMKMSQQEFKEQIAPLYLKNEQAVIDDWVNKKNAYYKRKNSLPHIVLGVMYALLPFVCFLICLFIKNIRKSTVFIVTSVAYFMHLLPYILVSHTYRYQYVLFALQAIFMFLVAYAIIVAIRPKLFQSKYKVLQEI